MHFKRILLPVIAGLLLSIPLNSGYVFTKDGGIVEGTITSDPAAAVTVRQKDSRARQIPHASNLRILYTEFYMGKVNVQKKDGKNVVCYMADEDRESYTSRKELYNPEELKLRSDHVLFITRGNPSGLDGEAENRKNGAADIGAYERQ